MKIQLGSEIFASYKRLSYKVWYALGEFVDNSTQAYFRNREFLDGIYLNEKTKLTVEITTDNNKFIRIRDNSIGMSKKELELALYVGKPPLDTKGRSKYGLGLKTGASWLGDYWTVTTKKYGEAKEYQIIVDVPKVAKGNLNIKTKERIVAKELHYTVIEIKVLHKKYFGKTTNKIKNYLRSMYRVDISKNILILKWNEEILKWNGWDDRLRKDKLGKIIKREFKFNISKTKKVKGWAGVLDYGKASRADAGFSLIQADRVIKGWPSSYRPISIFGDQEGGSNTLINQRLVGELYLDGFDVSHTKDDILFDKNEEEKLDLKLKKELGDLKKIAGEYKAVNSQTTQSGNIGIALNQFYKELNSDKVKDYILNYEIPNIAVWAKGNSAILKSLVQKSKPEINIKIDNLSVLLFLSKDMSQNDPYVIFEPTSDKNSISIVVNLNHPHWTELTTPESILNFYRHCVYDGVAEWKSYRTIGKIEPDTVKLIKDGLLRKSFQVED